MRSSPELVDGSTYAARAGQARCRVRAQPIFSASSTMIPAGPRT
jgi:hypothetical protein